MSLAAVMLEFVPRLSSVLLFVFASAASAQLGPLGRGRIVPRPSGHDVLIVIADDMAVVDYEQAQTPNLDLLASQSITFENAYANPTCSPSRHALLLGQWRSAGGDDGCMVDGTSDVRSHRSLPLMMGEAGYATALFGKWHAGSGRPWSLAALQAGFQTWRVGLPSNVRACDSSDPNAELGYGRYVRVDDGVVTDTSNEYHTIAVRDEFIQWWNTTSKLRFAVLSFQAPHGPFHRPPAALLPPGYPATGSNRDRYLAMITSLDTVMGQIFASVDLSNTVILFVGDNGTPPRVAGVFDLARSKGTTFERGIHVPLFVRVPRGAPAVDGRMAHLVDIYTTTLRLAGIHYPADGLDLLGPPSRPYVLCGRAISNDRCARSHRYKLRNVAGVEEFYDLQANPAESIDLIDEPSLQAVIEKHRNWLSLIP